MPQRNVASNYTFEQQRTEINLLAADFWTHKTNSDNVASSYLKHDGSNNFTGATLNVPNSFTIDADSSQGTLTINGNLTVSGTTTTVNTATLDVTDKNITIAKGNNADATADGAGITIDSDTDITWNFVNAKSAWVSSVGVEGTTFLKAPYGHFDGATVPTTGQGVQINAPDANTGQITSYDYTNNAYKELRIKGSSLNVYTGTTNALEATFNDTGLAVEGLTTAKSGLVVGSANQTKSQDGVIIERNSGDGYAHITAGRSGGNYSGFEFHVAGASGVTKRLSIDYESNIQFFKEDGVTAALHIDKDTKIGIGESSPDHLLHLKGDTPIIAAESSSWVAGVSAALRLSYTDGDAREIRGHYDNGLMFTTNQGEAMRIDTNGIVNSYFGTTISGTNSATPRFKVTTTNSSPDLRLHTWNDASGMYGLLGVNDYLDANGNNVAATADKKSAGIFLDGRSGKLIFRTKHDSGTSVLDRMIVTSTGYVGIGTTGPAKTGIQNNVSVLQIDSGDGAELILGNSTSQNVSVNHVGAIAFKNVDNSTGAAPHYCGIRSNCTDTSGNMNLKFYGGSTDFEADTPHMIIDSIGRIQVGTNNSHDRDFVVNTGGSSAVYFGMTGTNAGMPWVNATRPILSIGTDGTGWPTDNSTHSNKLVNFGIGGGAVGTSAAIEHSHFAIQLNGTILSHNGVQSGGNSTGGYKLTCQYSGKGYDIATQYATAANGGSSGGDPMFSGWWGSDNTFRVNTNGQIRARTLELTSPDESAQFAKYQVLTGAKVCAGDGAWTELFKIGHSAVGRLDIWAMNTREGYQYGMVCKTLDVQIIYGNWNLWEESSLSMGQNNGGTVNGPLTVQYVNTGGSTDYLIRANINYGQGGTPGTPWIYWQFSGASSITPYNIN